MTNIIEEIPTWYELKKFANTLEGEQLGQPVVFWNKYGDQETVASVEIDKTGKIELE